MGLFKLASLEQSVGELKVEGRDLNAKFEAARVENAAKFEAARIETAAQFQMLNKRFDQLIVLPQRLLLNGAQQESPSALPSSAVPAGSLPL